MTVLRATDARGPATVTGDALETESFDVTLETRADAFGVLHHSGQRLAIPRRLALPGQYLCFADADGDEQLIPLASNLIHVGRSSSADLRLEDVRVSRRHAIIARYAGQVRVLDDASSSGTYVNGRPVIALNLLDGDVVRLGPVAFTYLVVR